MQQPAFGERLRHLRTTRGLSQRALAGEHITASYISLLEAGRRVPTLDVVVHLAQTLEVPVNELVGDELDGLADADRPTASTLLTEVLARESMDFADYTQAGKILTEALERARDADQHARMVDVGLRLQDVMAATNQHAERLELLKELLELPPAKDSIELGVVLRTDLAGALRNAGELLEARKIALRALEDIGESSIDGTSQHVKLLGVLVSVMVEFGDTTKVGEYVDRLLEAASGIEGPSVKGRAHWVASRAYAQVGDRDAAEKHLTEAQRNLTSPTMPLRDWLRFCRSSAAVLLDVDGDLEQVRSWLENADTAARALGIPGEQDQVAALRARFEFATGNPQRCLEIVAPLLETSERAVEPDTGTLRLRLVEAQATAEVGRVEEAEALLRRLAADCEDSGQYEMAVSVWRQIDHLHNRNEGGTRDSEG